MNRIHQIYAEYFPSGRILYFIVILVLTLTSCRPDKEKLKAEIVQTEKDFAEMAEKEGIPEAFAFYVADSGVISSGDKLIKGKLQVKDHYLNWKYKDARLKWAPDFVDVSVSGDLGYTWGKYTFTFTDSTGKVIESKGIFHTVWKKQADGAWRFVWD